MAPSKKSQKKERWSPFRKGHPRNTNKPVFRISNPAKDKVLGGRGLVATTNIDRGSLILTDEPLVIIDTTSLRR